MFRTSKLSAAFASVSLLLLCIFAGVSDIEAQKSKRTKRSPPIKRSLPIKGLAIKEPSSDVCIPPNSDYISVLQIDRNAQVSLTAQTNQGSKHLFDANLPPSAIAVLTSIFNKSIVTVKADPSLRFDLVVKILKGARQAVNNCFNVEASTRTYDPYVYIYPEPKENTDLPVYPNPLLLVVHLDKNSDITLNNEKRGSLNDTSILINSMKQVFKIREDTGVLRPGSNLVEKAVRVKADGSARFGDVIRIVDALKDVGASPVGLQIDDRHADDLINPLEIIIPVEPRLSIRNLRLLNFKKNTVRLSRLSLRPPQRTLRSSWVE